MVDLGSQAPVLTYGRILRIRVRRPGPDIPLAIWLEVDDRPDVSGVTVTRSGDMCDTLVWSEAQTLYLGYRMPRIPARVDAAYRQVSDADKRIVLHEPDGGSKGNICAVVPVGLLYMVVNV